MASRRDRAWAQRLARGGITQDEAYQLARRAGANDREARFLAAVMIPESGGNPLARGPVTRYGYRAAGLWQIHPPEPGWENPLTNAGMALRKLRSQGRSAWEAFTRGLVKPYRPKLEGGRAPVGGASAAAVRPGPPSPALETPDTGAAFAQALINRRGNDPRELIAAIRLAPALQRAEPTGAVFPSSASGRPSGQPAGREALSGAATQAFSGYPGRLIGTPHAGTHTIGNWQSDNAVDLGMKVGTPIRAPEDGVIGNRIGSLGKSGRFAGQRVYVNGADEHYFAHLSRLVVKPGQRVRAGQIIGYSGMANGVPHLHYARRKGDPREYVRRK